MTRPQADWERYLKAVVRYGRLEAACYKTGIPYDSVVYHRNADATFKLRLEEARANHKGMARVVHIDSILKEDEHGELKIPEPALAKQLDVLANPDDYQTKQVTVTHQHYFFDVPPTPVLAEVEPEPIEGIVRELEDGE